MLDEISADFASLWVEMCAESYESEFLTFNLDHDLRYEVMWLEQEGYLVTNETDELFQVKLLGREEGTEKVRYCIKEGVHQCK